MVEKGKEKVTWIKLETESLKSEKNLMKIKKALFTLPQIRDQTYDEENNTVTIKVVCCSPEKLMDKLCSKGRGAIKRMNTIDMSKEAEFSTQKKLSKEAEFSTQKKLSKEAEFSTKNKLSKEAEKPKEPEKSEPAPAQTGPSSQPVMIQQSYPKGMYNEPFHVWAQPNGYPERLVCDSYRGYVQEEPSSCHIL